MTPESKDIIETVARWLEAGAPHTDTRGMTFDMAEIILLKPLDSNQDPMTWCGTSCCIAGAALAFGAPEVVAYADRHDQFGTGLQLPSVYAGSGRYSTWEAAKELLGLTEDQAQQLFAPWEIDDPVGRDYYTRWPSRASIIDAAWAARTIRHYIQTGDIRWDLTKEA